MRLPSTSRRFAVSLTSAALALSVLTACGEDDTDDSAASSGGDAVDTAVFGQEQAATGEPVKVGFVYEGVTPEIDTSDQFEAAEAVAEYANAYLGGLGGRPIEVVGCETKGQPAPAQDCGNQFIQEGVVAAVGGSLGQTDGFTQSFNPSKIPFVDIQNASPGLLQSGTGFSISNPLSSFAGPALYAKENSLTQVAMIVIDVPGAIGPAKQLAPLLFGNAGAKVDVIGIPPGTADMAPQVQAAEGKNPDMYTVIGNPAFCASALKAIKTLGLTVPVTGIDRCIDPTAAASIPGGFEGFTVFTPSNLDPESEEGELFYSIMKEYAGNDEPTPSASAGYAAMLGLVRAVAAGAPTEVTAESLLAAIKGMEPADIPLGGGGTFQCNGEALGILPAACSANVITADAAADGSLSNYELLQDPSIYEMPKS